MTTPNKIEKLELNDIFVFGSNLNGNHSGGAALQAVKWGAIEGMSEGLQGQTYAFPTLEKNLKRVSKKSIIESKEKLYQCAKENPSKRFLVTKIGCGIAGFSEDSIKLIFKGTKPNNIILPAGWSIIKGFKAFDKGLTCRGVQYELGKVFEHKGEIKPCASGFHFCKSLGDVYTFYSFGSVIAEVQTDGEVIDDETKSVTNRIEIIRILDAETEAKNNSNNTSTGYSNTGHSNTGHSNTGNRNTGYSNTGHRNTGHRNTGDWNTGDWNTGNSNTGYSNTGDWNTGNRNTGDWNTGNSNTGHSNTGDWNTGNSNTGYFNTKTPSVVLIFGKKCKKEKWNKAYKPSCLFFDTVVWIDFEDMTEKEKELYPISKTTGGYLKKLDYKKAFTESMKRASQDDIKLIKKFPNFNSKIFEEISGFKIK